jgi:uncharacterized SAM-dependent methyltransferase
VASQTLNYKKGQKIKMSHSGKYELETFQKLIGDISGFQCRAEYQTEDESFVLALISPK